MAHATTTPHDHQEAARGLIKRGLLVLALTGAVLSALWFLPPLAFNLGVTVVAMLALRELYLLDDAGVMDRGLMIAGSAAGTLLTLQMTLFPSFPFGITLTVLAMLLFSLAVVRTVGPSRKEVFELMFAMFGMIYVGGMFGQIVLIRNTNHGRELVLLLVLTVLAREVAAAISGRLTASSRPLNAHINPKKNYVGAALSIAAAVGAAIEVSRHIDAGFTSMRAWIFGLCLGVACQLGDLAESYLKRATGRRHSSTLLGPEGGLLDFLDAVAFAVVAARVLFYFWGY